MRYTPTIEQKIIEQIRATPDRPVILPEWAYWEGQNQPYVYIDAMPTPLIRHLYGLLIEVPPDEVGVTNPPGVDPRNVNPFLAVVTPSRLARPACAKGHIYTEADWIDGVGHQCQACRAERLSGQPSVSDINRAKTHCPKGHPYTKENTIHLRSGRRRCKVCHREQQAAYAARKAEA